MNRDEAINAIKTADLTPILSILEPAADRKSYICPKCGKGAHGDGLAYNKGSNRLHCFGQCGAEYDAIDLYRLKFNCDFITALNEVARIYGLSIDQGQHAPTGKPALIAGVTNTPPPPPPPRSPSAMDMATMEQWIERSIIHDIANARNRITDPACSDYLNRRGIPLAVAQKYGLGFIPNWQHPKTRAKGITVPPSPRLIIPTGESSYLARDTRPEDQIPEESKQYKKSKAGEQGIFNLDAIKRATEDNRPVFIVEGEIDAISFDVVGGRAIGLGSTAKVKSFLEALDAIGERRARQSLLIALDNDDAGRKATETLAQGLADRNIDYFCIDTAKLFNGAKDANEALTTDPAAFTKAVRNAEKAEIYAETNAAHLDILKDKFAQTPAPIPTGYKYLDDLFDGGLLTGVYFIGGVSSSGKTAFCMQIVDQVAKAGGSGLVFAAEMSRADLIARSISRETVEIAGDDYTRYSTQREVQAGYRYSDYGTAKLETINAAFEAYRQYAGRITVYQNQGDSMKPSKIRERIARFCRITGERPLVLIDYLQILTPEDKKQDVRTCVDDALRELKRVSDEFDLPIIVISSLNRDNYTTPLNLAAFKESGNIEYSADYLLGLQFSCVHDFSTKEAEKTNNLERLNEEKRKAIRDVEIVILKQRGGVSSGTVKFAYDARHNLYRQSQSDEEFLLENYQEPVEQNRHRCNLTGHSISEEFSQTNNHFQYSLKRAKPL